MVNVVKKASLRTAGLDYAKRAIKAPVLAGGSATPAVPTPQTRDYAKMSPYTLGLNDGPLTLDKLGGKPKKLKL